MSRQFRDSSALAAYKPTPEEDPVIIANGLLVEEIIFLLQS
jgi:hypothetical protein